MIRKLCIFTLVVSLVMPTFSQPARAGNDLEKFLAALTVMGLVAAVSKHDRKDPVVVQPIVKPQPKPVPKPKWGKHPISRFEKHQRIYETPRDRRADYEKTYRERKGKFARNLPKHCERVVRTDRGKQKIYSQKCLNENGYYTKRKRH